MGDVSLTYGGLAVGLGLSALVATRKNPFRNIKPVPARTYTIEIEMSTPNTIADLLQKLLSVDRTTTSIDNGTLTVTQGGKTISIPINSNSTIRNTISKF